MKKQKIQIKKEINEALLDKMKSSNQLSRLGV